jgi:transposase
MNLRANAALSLKGRRELCLAVVERERTVAQAAEAAGVSVRCARKWVGRYRAEGQAGLRDRSSAPHRIPHRTSDQRVEAIAALRRLRFTGPEIAEVLDVALSTVSGILARIGMGKLGRLGLEPPVRYERERPGELIHIDIKRLGKIQRGAGARITAQLPPGTQRRQSLKPFADEGRAGVDAHQFGATGTIVCELVRHFRRDDHDVAGTERPAFLAALEGEMSLLHDPGLVVGVAMQPRALPGIALVEDQ